VFCNWKRHKRRSTSVLRSGVTAYVHAGPHSQGRWARLSSLMPPLPDALAAQRNHKLPVSLHRECCAVTGCSPRLCFGAWLGCVGTRSRFVCCQGTL